MDRPDSPPDATNPYAPPASGGNRPRARPDGTRRRWAELAARSAAVVAGFSLLADPTALPGVRALALGGVDGAVLARFAGLALMAAAFLPWRPGRDGARAAGPPEAEEL